MKPYLKRYFPSYATLYNKDRVMTISYGFEERIKPKQMIPEIISTLTELQIAHFLVAISVNQSEIDEEIETLLQSFTVVHKQQDGEQYLVNFLLDQGDITTFVEKNSGSCQVNTKSGCSPSRTTNVLS